jgi:biopolymer transport protein TolR
VGPGIAEALITTAIGLVAAVPAVMAYNYFVRRIRGLSSEMESFASDFLDIVKRHFLKQSQGNAAMAMGGSHTPGTMMAEINVTPLVDVMLVLLIIFMITAPMLQQGVDVDLPDVKAQTIPDDEGKLVLTITKDRRYFLGRSEVPWLELKEKIRANAKVQSDKELYLHADKVLPYGDVVEIMAMLKDVGVDKIGMVTDPLKYAGDKSKEPSEASP